jgi:manganese efflux pump family protein
MNNIEIFLIAISLSADTFAVSIASGSKLKINLLINTLKMAIIFAFFQGAMPVLGWFTGNFLEAFVSSFAQWIAFFLLLAIGGKMIFESFSKNDKSEKNPFSFFIILILALATSIDALAIGIGFSMLNVSILYPAIIIGVITFIAAILGLYLGRKMAHFFENKIEFIGGLILICLGFRILF